MGMPKLGMHYDDVARRIKRISQTPGDINKKTNLINSLKNQCRLAEGEKSISELDRQLSSRIIPSSQSFSGNGTKQIGWGNGKRLGDGKWMYNTKNGKWEVCNG